MWRWFRNKAGAHPLAQPGGEIADEAEAGIDTLAEPRVWAPTVPMSVPAVLDEAANRRESELRRLAALQARGELAYQYVVETAARICQTPIAAIALLDGDTLWFKASVGICAESTAASHSPCLMVIEHSPAVTQIPDLRCEARFAGYPLLAAHPTTYYYAGAPLITSQGVPSCRRCSCARWSCWRGRRRCCWKPEHLVKLPPESACARLPPGGQRWRSGRPRARRSGMACFAAF